ncbi:hypothetical protein D3C80_1895230 [compost metagenome]
MLPARSTPLTCTVYTPSASACASAAGTFTDQAPSAPTVVCQLAPLREIVTVVPAARLSLLPEIATSLPASAAFRTLSPAIVSMLSEALAVTTVRVMEPALVVEPLLSCTTM